MSIEPTFMHSMQQGVMVRNGKPVTRASGAFAPPNLAEMVAKYQAFLAPEDPRFGEGISGWDITSEYDNDPRSQADGSPIWGCMCSPSVLASDGRRVKLQPEDIAAKRAHIVVRTPTNSNELIEIERTVLHELGHVLHAKLNLPRDEEEEIMHSLDHFFSKLSPEQGQILARSFQNPMARAYRAETTAMPDPIEDPKKPDKEAPKMQEGGAEMSVEEIKAALVKAVLDGQPTEELAKKLVAAMATAGASGPPSAPMAPAEPPTMGMKPDDAYARAKKEAEAAAEIKAVKAFAASVEGITAEQRAEIADAPSMERAQRLLKTYPRQSQGTTLGALPGKIPGAKPAQSVRERAMSADDDVMARVRRSSSNEDTAGIILDIPGHSVGWSPSQWLKEELGKHERRMKAQQEAGQ